MGCHSSKVQLIDTEPLHPRFEAARRDCSIPGGSVDQCSLQRQPFNLCSTTMRTRFPYTVLAEMNLYLHAITTFRLVCSEWREIVDARVLGRLRCSLADGLCNPAFANFCGGGSTSREITFITDSQESPLALGIPDRSCVVKTLSICRMRSAKRGMPQHQQSVLQAARDGLFETVLPNTSLHLRGLILGDEALGQVLAAFSAASARHVRQSQLQGLDLSENALGNTCTKTLDALTHPVFAGVSRLSLDNNWLGMQCQIQLGLALPGLNRLQRVSLKGCCIGPDGMAAIADGLMGGSHSSLQSLNLACNALGERSMQLLVELTQACPRLEHLDIDHNPLGREGGVQLAAVLARSTSLRELKASNCSLPDAAAVELGAGLCSAVGLQRLHLRNNSFSDLAAPLLSSIADIPGLQELSIGGNALGSASISALVCGLAERVGTPLLRLDISNTSVSSATFAGVPRAWGRVLQHLEQLDLSMNALSGTPDVAALCEAVGAGECAVEFLNLAWTGVTGSDLEALPVGLRRFPHLRQLRLSGNHLPPDAVALVCKGLQGRRRRGAAAPRCEVDVAWNPVRLCSLAAAMRRAGVALLDEDASHPKLSTPCCASGIVLRLSGPPLTAAASQRE